MRRVRSAVNYVRGFCKRVGTPSPALVCPSFSLPSPSLIHSSIPSLLTPVARRDMPYRVCSIQQRVTHVGYGVKPRRAPMHFSQDEGQHYAPLSLQMVQYPHHQMSTSRPGSSLGHPSIRQCTATNARRTPILLIDPPTELLIRYRGRVGDTVLTSGSLIGSSSSPIGGPAASRTATGLGDPKNPM